MIYHDLKLIFIHIERTGGSSFKKHLIKYSNNITNCSYHASLDEIHNLSNNVWDKYFKVAFVRNPFDRLVSWYTKSINKSNWSSPVAKYFKNYNNFNSMINGNIPDNCLKIKTPQYDRIYKVDFIAKFENYNEDSTIICNKIGIPPVDIHINQSGISNYKKYYSDKSVGIVSEWYKTDLDKFGYTY